MLFRQSFNQLILDEVRILKFIHHHILAEVLIRPQHLGIFFKEECDKEEKISKIDSIISTEIFLISLIDEGQPLFKDVELGGTILIRRDSFVLQPVDRGLHGPGVKHLEVKIQFFHDGFQMPFLILLIIDDKIPLKTQVIDMLSQDSGTRGVKGGDPYPLRRSS